MPLKASPLAKRRRASINQHSLTHSLAAIRVRKNIQQTVGTAGYSAADSGVAIKTGRGQFQNGEEPEINSRVTPHLTRGELLRWPVAGRKTEKDGSRRPTTGRRRS